MNIWGRGVVVITTAQLHSSRPEQRFYAGSNPARGVSEIRDGEDLWQWSQPEIRLHLSSVNRTTKTIHHHHHHPHHHDLYIKYNINYICECFHLVINSGSPRYNPISFDYCFQIFKTETQKYHDWELHIFIFFKNKIFPLQLLVELSRNIYLVAKVKLEKLDFPLLCKVKNYA